MPRLVYFSVQNAQGKTRTIPVSINRLWCAGYAGRNKRAVLEHIRELKRSGVSAPRKVPTLYALAPYILLSDSDTNHIEVKGKETSAEVEWVAIVSDQIYITVGSDHTDRWLEKISVGTSKQACPKIISSMAWLYRDIKDHWDEITMECWMYNGKKKLYQRGKFSDIMKLEELIHVFKVEKGTALFSGTVPTVSGKLIYARGYDLLLKDPYLKRSIELRYNVKVLPRDES